MEDIQELNRGNHFFDRFYGKKIGIRCSGTPIISVGHGITLDRLYNLQGLR